jgi:hypothetical protein
MPRGWVGWLVVSGTTMKRVLAALLLLACIGLPAAQPPSRIVVVGDVHGDLAALVATLVDAGVIDKRRNWKGGTAIFVQTGDVPDRGPHSRKVMDLLIDLEKQARKAGGRVHALLGNHEVMNMLGDLRYVTPEEYASYRSFDSEKLRENVLLANGDPARIEDPLYRSAWMADKPLGWVELTQAFSKEGKYGRWLRQHDTVVKIGTTLFLHGGISPKYATLAADQINARIKTALASDSPLAEPLLIDEEGPLWYRGLALAPEADLRAHVDALLAFHGVSRIVVGHTVAPGVVLPRFGGKVILNDVGLSAVYGGPRSSLEITGDVVSVRHRGTRLPVPTTPDLSKYLQAARALEPSGSTLDAWMEKGAIWPGSVATTQQR